MCKSTIGLITSKKYKIHITRTDNKVKTLFLILIGISVVNADFIRDDTTGIVKDTTAQLEWQDNSVTTQMDWHTAISYCEGLNLEGTGWKLPNINQLNSLIDYSNSPAINSAFTYTGNWYYFSSTTNLDRTDSAFSINQYGENAYGRKTDHHYVRCVRTAQ